MARSSPTPSTQSAAVDESQAAQADDDHTQTQVESTHKADQVPLSLSSIMPMIALVVRIITLVSLILSISLIASNSTSVKIDTGLLDSNSTSISIPDNFIDNVITVQFKFNDIYAYRYALATAVIGMTYTLLQLAFSIYQVMSGKRLTVNHVNLLVYDFIGDKVILSLVATGVGAIFGATLDLKNNIDKVEDAVELYLDTTLDPFISKLDDFFSRAYIPAIFLLIAFITCGISSILSSLALNKKTQ